MRSWAWEAWWWIRPWKMQHNEQHEDESSSVIKVQYMWQYSKVSHGNVQQIDKMQHYDRWMSHLRESVEAICLQLISCQYQKSKWLTSIVNVLSLSLSLLNFEEHKRIIDQGFPHTLCGLSLASATSCVLLSWHVFCDLYLCSICSLSYCWCDF